MQTKKKLGIAIPLSLLMMTGCTPETVDYVKVENIVADAVATEIAASKREAKNMSFEEGVKLVQLKSIEYPRFASMVAFRINNNGTGGLQEADVPYLKDKLKELESDLYLQTFYASLKKSAGFTKEVVPLETKNRSGYRIRDNYDMVLSPDSYFSENFPVNGQIIISDELVPYAECKDGYQPILLHSALHKPGESVVEPFEVNVANEVAGWRVSFDGYRVMTDLACVPQTTKQSDSIEKLLAD